MPNFDHTGPNGDGSCAGRGMGQRMGQMMNRGCGKARNAAERGMGNCPQNWQDPEPGTEQGAWQEQGQKAGAGAGQGRCRRHGQGQGQNNSARNRCMNGQAAGMPQGRGKGRCMSPTGQAKSCGSSPTAGSDGTDNNS